MLQLVIFDLDGTLVDSLSDLTTAMNVVLAERSLPARTVAEVRELVGDGARALVARSLGGAQEATIDEATIDEALRRFREIYAGVSLEATAPYTGIPEVIEKLAALPLALATNKPERYLSGLLGAFGWTGRFDPVLGGDSLATCKPHPLMVETCCARRGVLPADALMVGDSHQDVLAARAAGVPVCGVTWGFRARAVLEDSGADYIVESPVELLTLVERLTAS